MKTNFHKKNFRTKTRFEEEAHMNSEMAYYGTQYSRSRGRGGRVGGGGGLVNIEEQLETRKRSSVPVVLPFSYILTVVGRVARLT